jgi:hypothetical protein
MHRPGWQLDGTPYTLPQITQAANEREETRIRNQTPAKPGFGLMNDFPLIKDERQTTGDEFTLSQIPTDTRAKEHQIHRPRSASFNLAVDSCSFAANGLRFSASFELIESDPRITPRRDSSFGGPADSGTCPPMPGRRCRRLGRDRTPIQQADLQPVLPVYQFSR